MAADATFTAADEERRRAVHHQRLVRKHLRPRLGSRGRWCLLCQYRYKSKKTHFISYPFSSISSVIGIICTAQKVPHRRLRGVRHFVRESDQHILQHVTQSGGLSVSLPNGSHITYIATGTLTARPVNQPVIIPTHVFPDRRYRRLHQRRLHGDAHQHHHRHQARHGIDTSRNQAPKGQTPLNIGGGAQSQAQLPALCSDTHSMQTMSASAMRRCAVHHLPA
jgi:hypothetical protein